MLVNQFQVYCEINQTTQRTTTLQDALMNKKGNMLFKEPTDDGCLEQLNSHVTKGESSESTSEKVKQTLQGFTNMTLENSSK